MSYDVLGYYLVFMFCVCNKFNILFCSWRILFVDKDKDNIALSGQIGCQKKKKGMYVQEYSVHSNKVIHSVICEGWHFTHMSKALA